jgi:DNA-binding transcriptional ArsR family regulator
MKRLLWWLLAGTKGGINRAKMIKLIHDRPYNANQMAKKLDLDYKTVRHHLRVLEKNNVITSSGSGGKKYGAMYFLSTEMDMNYDIFKEIWEQIGNNQIKDDKDSRGDEDEEVHN